MTSPPYYGLRAYKAEPLIWDAQDCEHEWGDEILKQQGNAGSPKQPTVNGSYNIQMKSNFCIHCNAWKGQLGSEPTPDLYIKHLCDIFDDVKRVLKKTGTIYVNLDDSHSGSGNGTNDYRTEKSKSINGIGKYSDNVYQTKPASIDIPAKSLIGIPERFMLEMINRKWICRNVIIWHKESVMPESVKDRFTIDFERIFFFSQSQKYFFERQFEPYSSEPNHNLRNKASEKYLGTNLFSEGARDYYSMGQRNKRTTWTINPQGFNGPHYATYPEELCRTPIEASCPEFVCTKCGKPRTKIYKTQAIGHTKTDVSGQDGLMNPEWTKGRAGELEQELIGLSDCGCGEPFEPGVCLDPFSGVATTGVMAKKLGRKYIGIEISEKYHQMAIKRVMNTVARMI